MKRIAYYDINISFFILIAKIFFLTFLCVFNICSEENKLTINKFPGSKNYIIGNKVELEFSVTSENSPEKFILKELKGPELKGLEISDSKISILSAPSDKILTTYHVKFIFKVLVLGEGEISPIKMKFLVDGSKDEELETVAYKINVVTRTKKYLNHLILLISSFVITVLVLLIQKKIKKGKALAETAKIKIEFKQRKIDAENQAKEKFKQLGKYIISGEYGKYCDEILKIIGEYFALCHKNLDKATNVSEMRDAVRFFDEDIQKKMTQILNLMEEIQFANKSPMQSDLDRLQTLSKEVIARHREYFEI